MASLKTGLIIGVAAAGVAAAALAGGGIRLTPVLDAAGGHHLAVTQASTATIFSPPPGAPESFADIFEKVSPAVVSIDVTTHLNEKMLKSIPGLQGLPFGVEPKGGGGDDGGGDGDGDDGDGGQPQGPKAQSSGSGFFISPDGYIVTNNHVVENAEDIKITLKNGDILPATVVGHDDATDLAVIKVKGSGFPFVDFENSAKPRVGDWVIAIGNPFGLGNTATAGIVSAYGRDIGDSFVDFIQIDAPINRGNSGGPTFDTYGRVIGVNSAIFSPSGGSVGIGFAIPADVADQITKALIAGGKITRGYMGASIQNVTPEVADSLGMTGRKGALVAEVVPGGPAEKAGVHAGDVVVALNGQPVNSNTELTRLVAQSHSGDVLHVDVIRDGKPREIDVRSGVRPSEDQLASNDNGGDDSQQNAPEAPAAEHPHVLGMTLGALDEGERRRLSLPSEARGALVLGVKDSSDAGDKGLRAGDLIVRAGDTDVGAPSDVQAAVTHAKQAGRSSILLGVRRDGRTSFVPIKLEG
jgi:serine protease Do